MSSIYLLKIKALFFSDQSLSTSIVGRGGWLSFTMQQYPKGEGG